MIDNIIQVKGLAEKINNDWKNLLKKNEFKDNSQIFHILNQNHSSRHQKHFIQICVF
jgi:hypothetical protein